jgi:hypothetical protein
LASVESGEQRSGVVGGRWSEGAGNFGNLSHRGQQSSDPLGFDPQALGNLGQLLSLSVEELGNL